MTAADAPAFARLMQRLGTVFKPLSKALQHEYFDALRRDLTLEQAGVAVGRAVRELRSRPVPVVLKDLALGTPQQREALAWATVRRFAGWPPDVRDTNLCLCAAMPILVTVMVMGGWEHLEERIDSESTREEFLEVYREIVSPDAGEWMRSVVDKVRGLALEARRDAGLTGMTAAEPFLLYATVPAPDREAEQITWVCAIFNAAAQGGLG